MFSKKIPRQRCYCALKCRDSIKLLYFTSFAKRLNAIRSYVKELQTTKCIFVHKSCFFILNHQKMCVQHRIALKPAKACSTHDFTIRKQFEDKTKNSKKSWIFQFLDVLVQWKFHVFKRKSTQRCPGTFECTYSVK